MQYRVGMIGNVFIVRWLGVPSKGDNHAVLRDLRDARRRLGRNVVFLNVTPEDVDLPGAEARADMQSITPEMLECTDAVQLLIEGTGVARTMLRSLVRAMNVAGRRGDKVLIHASLADFVRANEAALGIDRATFLVRVERENLM